MSYHIEIGMIKMIEMHQKHRKIKKLVIVGGGGGEKLKMYVPSGADLGGGGGRDGHPFSGVRPPADPRGPPFVLC